jgi:hypothetical protein
MAGIVVYKGGKPAAAGGGIVRYEGSAQSTAGDPYWDNVVSLLLFNEAAGEIAVTDEKGVAWTRDGAAIMSSGESRFGTTSLFVPNITGYDGIRTDGGLIPTFTPFTIEGWIYITDQNGYQSGWNPLIGHAGDDGAGTDQIFGLSSGRVAWFRGAGLSGQEVSAVGSTVASTNQWHHIEMSFDGYSGRLFLNGAIEAQESDIFGWINVGPSITIGRHMIQGIDSGRVGLRGYIDSIRITAGVCRHTASFTPPSAPFPIG